MTDDDPRLLLKAKFNLQEGITREDAEKLLTILQGALTEAPEPAPAEKMRKDIDIAREHREALEKRLSGLQDDLRALSALADQIANTPWPTIH